MSVSLPRAPEAAGESSSGSSARNRVQKPSGGDRAPARSRALTRQRILESGTALFASRGLHDVTSHDIANAAGVAAGTFYNHFKDKHELFREIAFATLGSLKDRLVTAGASESERPRRMRLRAEALAAFAEENRDLVRILFGRDGEAATLGADVLDDFTAWLQVEIESQGRRHPEIAAQAVVGMWARTLAWWAESPERARREEIVDTLVELQVSV